MVNGDSVVVRPQCNSLFDLNRHILCSTDHVPCLSRASYLTVDLCVAE
jgi:hypothetical protein